MVNKNNAEEYKILNIDEERREVEEYSKIENLISAIASDGIRPGLERISRLLELLNNPQNNFPAFHVVGTNGKGSTCAYLDSVLRASGYKTALYTSPHLESPGERLLINGEQLDGSEWLNAVNKISELIKDDKFLSLDPPSYFEIVTAAAFLLMSDKKIDVAVIEAGLGGRLDATNLLGRVVCSVIASISIDHMEFLGDTLEKIAGEKFAVVRPDTPACFLGDNPSLIDLFNTFCNTKHSIPFIVSKEAWLENVNINEDGCVFDFYSKNLSLNNLKIKMLGRYQLSNASLALSALSCALKYISVSPSAIRRGMENARWPGRLEIISREPLIILDGGHNRDGVEKLVQSVSELFLAANFEEDGEHGKRCKTERINFSRRIGVIYAAMRDKDYQGCLAVLNTLKNAAFYATAAPGIARSLPENDMFEAAKKFSWRNDKNLKAFKSPLDAVNHAIDDKNEVILICGSLYLIGWIRPRLIKQLGV